MRGTIVNVKGKLTRGVFVYFLKEKPSIFVGKGLSEELEIFYKRRLVAVVICPLSML